MEGTPEAGQPIVEPGVGSVVLAPDYGYIAGRVAVYGGLVAGGVLAAWITMRLLNRTHLGGLTDVQYLPASTVSEYGVIQEKRDFYNNAILPKELGGPVRTVDMTTGPQGWVAIDDNFNYEDYTDEKGNVIPAQGPLYDSRCEKGGAYGCNSRNPADEDFKCTTEDVDEYCKRVWENNNAWWRVYNTYYDGQAGMACKIDGQFVDCDKHLPYPEQAVKCFQDLEYQRANPDYCSQFRNNYCSGVMDQIGCAFASELPAPSTVDWSQPGLKVITIGTNGYHWPDNRGKDTVRVLSSPVIDTVQPNLPVCPDPTDPHCQTGNELVPVRSAARFAGSSNTILGYGYYSGELGSGGTPDVPNGQFTNSFPQKTACSGGTCDQPAARAQKNKRSNIQEGNRFSFYNTTSTLRSGGQA